MKIKRWIFAVLAILCLTMPVCAEEETFASRIETFMAEKWLTESNFSMVYYDTVTGEEYSFNADAMMMAASTYKLPLNMYYYEMEARGEIAPQDIIPNSGTTLANCHRMSIVDSNNEVSVAMLYNLGNFRTYKDCMRSYFTAEEVPSQYYADNYYSTAMMMDALKYLYAHEADFAEMIGYMKQARPGEYFKKYISDCEIAHKYGSFEGAENDVGILYASHPILLAVYTQGVGEDISAQVAKIAKEYTDERFAALEKEAQQAEEPAAPAEAANNAPVQTTQKADTPTQKQSGPHPALWILPGISVLCALAALVLTIVEKRKERKAAV